MRKLIMWNLVTLDGYFEREKEWDLGFHEAVWGKELEEFSIRQLNSAGMLIFGRTTYEGMANYWTKAEGEIAKFMNEIQKAVCSATLKIAEWNNTTIIKDAVNEIRELKESGEKDMFVFGSSDLSDSLIRAGLFDEYRLCIAPVFLGGGKPLFKKGTPYRHLNLLEVIPLGTGGVIVRYGINKKG